MESCNPLATFREVSIGLKELQRIFKVQFDQLQRQGYFRQELGCTRATGCIPGPVRASIEEWSEEDLFVTIEFLHRLASKPLKPRFLRRQHCAGQCAEFDRDAGQEKFRQVINRALRYYGRGFELLRRGGVRAFAPTCSQQIQEVGRGVRSAAHHPIALNIGKWR
jgi:hypothetical protein